MEEETKVEETFGQHINITQERDVQTGTRTTKREAHTKKTKVEEVFSATHKTQAHLTWRGIRPK